MLKSQVDALNDPNISKREYDETVKKIDAIIKAIWEHICKKRSGVFTDQEGQKLFKLVDGEALELHDTSGVDRRYQYENDEFEEIPSFDPIQNQVLIKINGWADPEFYVELSKDEYFTSENKYYNYFNGFPTELIWTPNWQEVVDNHITEAIAKLTSDRIAKLTRNKEKKERKKQNEKEERERQKREHQQFVDIIQGKLKSFLTDEEYQIVMNKVSK